MTNLIKNQFHTVTIENYSSECYGVCRIDGRAVFVPRALKGETWKIKILKVSASAVFAKGEELISASPARRESLCPYYGKCGGCDTWHMSYEEELRFKLSRVNDALAHIGKQNVSALEIIGSERTERYRNKAIFAVSGSPADYGFFRERSHELVSVPNCLIQNELSERAAAAVTSFMRENNISAYSEETGKGTVRHVYSRSAVNTEDSVVCIVSARGFGVLTGSLVEKIRSACPELTGIVLNINKTRGNSVLAGDFYTLYGRSDMRDILCSNEFSIAPQAFFQINPPQAERLYRKAVEYAALAGDELVLDMYCGAGTISLCLAEGAKKVIGAEIVPEAIENARLNAENNGIKNVEFICADAGEAAQEFIKRGLHPKVIVVDPPRKGMDENTVVHLASMLPERIVYVSCNPATLARDILRFSALGYELKKATAVDMFPRTSHVESVVKLERKDVKSKDYIEIGIDAEDYYRIKNKGNNKF